MAKLDKVNTIRVSVVVPSAAGVWRGKADEDGYFKADRYYTQEIKISIADTDAPFSDAILLQLTGALGRALGRVDMMRERAASEE